MNINEVNHSQTRQPGWLDLTFAEGGTIAIGEQGTANSITSDKLGRLIVLSEINGLFRLSRYLVDGATDESFEETNWSFEENAKSVPTRVLLQEDGKIIVIGSSIKDRIARPAVTRFNPNGSPDLVFGRKVIEEGPDGSAFPTFRRKFVDGCLQKNQGILISASYELSSDGTPWSRLFCLNNNGELDQNFGQGQGFIDIALHGQPSYVSDVQVQSNGNIIVAGFWSRAGEASLIRTVARYSAEGTFDCLFGVQGYADLDVPDEQSGETRKLFNSSYVSRLCIQSDDKILLVGNTRRIQSDEMGLLTRFDQEGSVDEEFNEGKTLFIRYHLDHLFLNSAAIQPDGRILVVGRGEMADTTMEFYERISPKGEVESFWSGNSVGDCTDVTIQPSGRVIISGSSGTSSSRPRYPRVWGRLGS